MLMKTETNCPWKNPGGRNEYLLRSLSKEESKEGKTS